MSTLWFGCIYLSLMRANHKVDLHWVPHANKSWFQISCGYHMQIYLCELFSLVDAQISSNYEGVVFLKKTIIMWQLDEWWAMKHEHIYD
jgi:hypothetical protein